MMQFFNRAALRQRASRGFTLIEILVVIGIIAILAAIVIIAINPARQFAQARNSQRQSNITAILNAIGQDVADNKGVFTCTGIVTAIGSATTTIGTNAGDSNLESCFVPTYMSLMVMDPNDGSSADTHYQVSVDSNGRYLVCAPEAAETAITGSSAICIRR